MTEDKLSGTMEHAGPPVTDYACKMVMLRAERSDTLAIDGHGEMTVVKRTTTYYGPRLLLADGQKNWLLTAPGPAHQLQLWRPNYTDDEGQWRDGWIPHEEVTAELVDMKQYDICSQCGEPLKTMEHERQAAFGVCLNEEQ